MICLIISSGCSTLTKTEYIDREIYIYKAIPESYLEECSEPVLLGKTFRDGMKLLGDYKSSLDKCNIQLEQIETWDNAQKEQLKINN